MTDRAVWEAAVDWHVRQETMDADDWLRFVEWLEADPSHAATYDTVSVADALRHDAKPEVEPEIAAANDNPPRHGRWWLGAGVAAAVLVAALSTLHPPGQSRTVVAATPQTLRLVDGSAVALAANARLTIGAGGPRDVRLDSGRATFHVVHDAAHPFAVRVGAWTVQDVGTVFTVTHANDGLDIAVSEGAIMLDPQGAALPVHAGEAVSVAGGGATPIRSEIAQNGARTLRFSGESLGTVARTVALALNVGIAVTPDAARAPFIGTLRLTGRAAEDIPHLAAMTGMRSTNDGRTWTIASAGAAH
jgi:transmembrane sensor